MADIIWESITYNSTRTECQYKWNGRYTCHTRKQVGSEYCTLHTCTEWHQGIYNNVTAGGGQRVCLQHYLHRLLRDDTEKTRLSRLITVERSYYPAGSDTHNLLGQAVMDLSLRWSEVKSTNVIACALWCIGLIDRVRLCSHLGSDLEMMQVQWHCLRFIDL
jgi:hypothetical protein